MKNPNSRLVALDVGSKRVGVATANVVAKIASPLTTLEVSDDIFLDIKKLLDEQVAVALVLGLPRGLEGQNTQQTTAVNDFADNLKKYINLPIFWQDEALTSRQSRLELSSKKAQHSKGAVDALAATYILEDFLANNDSLEFTS